jgi:hypothetical protein
MNVAIGNRADAGLDPNYTMQLLLDGVPFASVTNPVLPADGEFLVAQLTGVAPSIGQLGIRFTSISGQTFLDDVNVYLVSAAVPEGNSLTLFAVCGGLGLVAMGMRRKLVKRKG